MLGDACTVFTHGFVVVHNLLTLVNEGLAGNFLSVEFHNGNHLEDGVFVEVFFREGNSDVSVDIICYYLKNLGIALDFDEVGEVGHLRNLVAGNYCKAGKSDK